jgi:hypothetical protein
MARTSGKDFIMESMFQVSVTGLFLTALLWPAEGIGQRNQSDPPDGFREILPRGRIAAIFEPEYVSAEKARIRPDAWVLGVVIDGQARAYSLTLLNSHEVVNDRIGDTSFAAVW